MPEAAPLRAVHFTDEAQKRIVEAVRPNAVPERLALLPELLCAWAEGGLIDHLSRERRAVIKQRIERLTAVSKRASYLLDAVEALDEEGQLQIACGPQTRRKRQPSNARWASATALSWPDGIFGAELRREEALSWLCDLVDALSEPGPEPPPDKSTRGYLVVLDLAAIFQFVTCIPPARRNKADSESGKRLYGPFFDFVNSVCESIPEVKSLDDAIKRVVAHYPDHHRRGPARSRRNSIEYSQWFANLQFSHPSLWQKVRRASR
jgi:hypothetical protein